MASRPRRAARSEYRLDDQVGFLLRVAMQRHTSIFMSRIVKGLTQTQFAALAKLREVGPCSQNQLGRLIYLDAATTKGVVDRLDDGLWALLRNPELYAWALVAIAGTAYQQASFRAGSLTASLPTMTVSEPFVGSVLGVVVLGEALRPGDAGWFTLIVAVAAMVVATAALARGEAATVSASQTA